MINQALWLNRRWTFNFDVDMFPMIYSRLEGSISRLQFLFANADETKVGKAINGWSAKEHLGHLYDLEKLWWNRWEDYKTKKEVLTAADITNRITTEANYNLKNIHELIAAFVRERQKILDAIYSCDEELLKRTSLHPRLKTPMRLVDYLYFVAEHDDHHIAAIMMLLRN